MKCDTFVVVVVVVVLLVTSSSTIIGGCGAVQITALRVPPAVRNGSASTLLDCEYSLRPDELLPDSGLVVKWFFNQGPAPVYQWIPGQRPQELGVLRGRLDLSHRASEHRASVHRALLIATATTELAGEYKCAVSTFQDEDFMSKRMLVFVPQESLELSERRPTSDTVNLSCRAQGVFPEPKMALYKDTSRVKARLGPEQVHVQTTTRGGVYDVTASTLLDERLLTSPTIFDCELNIPEANYMVRKSIVYYAGIFKPTSDSGSSATVGTVRLLCVCLVLWVLLGARSLLDYRVNTRFLSGEGGGPPPPLFSF